MKRRIVLGLCACAVSLLGAMSVLHRREVVLYNHSPSIPIGFYIRSSEPLRIGAIVTVRAAEVAPEYAAVRNFTAPGDRFIKRIAATAGDSACTRGAQLTINGRTVLLRAATDSVGRPLPHWNGCRALNADEVLLLGDTSDSFDSRYFGPVRRDAIEGVWQSLL